VKVSRQVRGIRQDADAPHRIQVEEDKPQQDQGRYLLPELFGGTAGAGGRLPRTGDATLKQIAGRR
jgi:hypothetical protein